MRIQLFFGFVFFTLCSIAQAQIEITAAKPAAPINTVSLCRLLTAADLIKIGYDINTSPRDNEMDMTTEMSGAPTAMHTDLCFYYADAENSRKSVSFAIDRFEKMDGVVEWLKMKNDAAKTDTTVMTEFGDTICEEGDYPFTVSKTAPRTKEMTQFYVACDRIVDHRRISLSIENPVERTSLPSPTETKILLDLAISRLNAVQK